MKIEAIKKEKITTDLEIVGATLLSLEEAELVPKALRRYKDWWWLRSPSCDSWAVTFVNCCGSVDRYGLCTDYRGCVRPALIIKNLESSNLKIGDTIFFDNKEFEIISDTLAFCTIDIGYSCFNSDYEKEDVNIYETSDIKKLVDYWFEKRSK